MSYFEMNQDPYYHCKSVVEGGLVKAQKNFESWKDRLENSDTNQDSFRAVHKALISEIKKLSADLKALEEAVQIINDNPENFNFSESEIQSRNRSVQDFSHQIKAMKSFISGDKVKFKLEHDKKEALTRKKHKDYTSSSRHAVDEDNDKYIHSMAQNQEMIIRQQDNQLEELDTVLTNVEQIALTINDGLQQQDKLISELDEDIEVTQSKMGFVMGKLGKLLKTNNNCQLYTVCILSLGVLILVIILIFF